MYKKKRNIEVKRKWKRNDELYRVGLATKKLKAPQGVKSLRVMSKEVSYPILSLLAQSKV